MRKIVKNPEPRSLTQYRSQGNEYDGPNFTPVKHEIKLSLLEEQGHLCAYCMNRIFIGEMKVEHWACQERHLHRQLDYSNLLACCKGNEGNPPAGQTCDTRKANSDIKYNPADSHPNINNLIRYLGQGKVSSTDADFNRQINDILNLNHPFFVENRAAAIESIRKKLGSRNGRRTKSELESLIARFKAVDHYSKLSPYCAVVISYIESKLK